MRFKTAKLLLDFILLARAAHTVNPRYDYQAPLPPATDPVTLIEMRPSTYVVAAASVTVASTQSSDLCKKLSSSSIALQSIALECANSKPLICLSVGKVSKPPDK